MTEEMETAPLLQAASLENSSQASCDRQGEDSSHHENLAPYTFYVALVVLFLINAGTAIAVPPTTSVLQDVICERHFARLTDTPLPPVSELNCKAEAVQASLAMVKGLVSLLLLLPGIALAVPYATLAERWRMKNVLLLSISGIFLGELWFDLVCWYGRIWPIGLIYLAPVFYLIGGGPSVGGSLHFVIVANASPSHLRSSRCFLLEAAAFSGSVFGYLASSAIMDKALWTPIYLGLAFILTSFCLVLPVPEQVSLPTRVQSAAAQR